jgi:hypothetical protein
MWPATSPTKFVVWGHPHYSHTHSYIHYGYHKAAIAMGWDAVWLPNTPEAAQSLGNTDGYLFLTEGQVHSHMPKNPNAFYVLHNCDGGLYTTIPESHKLFFQVFTKDVYERDVVPVKDTLYEFWQANANTLYGPWATDLLPAEIDANIQQVEAGILPNSSNRRAIFLGSVYGGVHGNIDQINAFRQGCQIPFNTVTNTNINQAESIRQQQSAILAPAIVGGWQKEKGYIPCRIFKTISYGQLGVTNSKEAYEVVGGLAVYDPNEQTLASKAMGQLEDRTLRVNAMKCVRDKHTYINRLNTLQTVFKEYKNPPSYIEAPKTL